MIPPGIHEAAFKTGEEAARCINMLFDGLDGLLRVALAAIVAYAVLVLILRVTGKRSLAKLNAFDFVVTVAFGSTLATIILSKDVALAEGVLALAMLALLQFAVSLLSVRFGWIKNLVRSEPVLLVRDGEMLDDVMDRERVTRDEVEAAIRKEGIGAVEDVRALVLETDGSFSVIRHGGSDTLTALRSVAGPRRA